MRRFHKGFSLVEILVALGMAAISMVVIMQVFAVFEGGKRTTTSGADAQTNGALALYMIERDTKMGGWGMDANVYANCNTTFSYCDGSASCGGAEGPLADLAVASVQVTDGGTGPDSVAAQYFANPTTETFRYPGATTLSGTMPQSSSELRVSSLSGCTDDPNGNNMALVSQAGNCTLMKVTQVQAQAGKIQHNPGANGEFNPPASYQNEHNWPAYTEGASVSCFKPAGSRPIYQRSYAIDAAAKQLQRINDGESEVVAPEIADLQVQYGVAPTSSQVVNEWVDATGPVWGNPTPANRRRIKAVRIALVARSAQYEKPDTGASCSTTTSEMVEGWSAWANFDTASYSSDWQCYRYKVFETVIPLRNIMWGNI